MANQYPVGYTPPSTSSSLTQLHKAMCASFEARGIVAPVYLGLKHRDNWDTSRVVIIDGEFDGSNTPRVRNAGQFRAPTQKKSVNPRELVSWPRPITLSIRAVNGAEPDNMGAQVEATETLIEQTLQALWNATVNDPDTGQAVGLGQANIDLESSKCFWCDPGSATQQTWGQEFLFQFIYKCTFFDQAFGVTAPSPNLEKGPLLSTSRSGVNAAIATALAMGTSVISNLGNCHPTNVGKQLTLAGAATGANNGSFPIVYFLGPTSLVISNPSAVADANNGSIAWSVGP